VRWQREQDRRDPVKIAAAKEREKALAVVELYAQHCLAADKAADAKRAKDAVSKAIVEAKEADKLRFKAQSNEERRRERIKVKEQLENTKRLRAVDLIAKKIAIQERVAAVNVAELAKLTEARNILGRT
jgi:hypothetical protein